MRLRGVALAALLAASPLAATVRPGVELYLPSVAHAPGALPGSQFVTDVWIYNPAATATTVTAAFSFRGPDPAAPPQPVAIEVGAGAVVALPDIVRDTFGLSSAVGGLRFLADQAVTVTAHIYDDAVVGSYGTGTAGQFFAATPVGDAITAGGHTDIVGISGVTGDGIKVWRTNVGFMNASAGSTTVKLSLFLPDGTALPATRTDTFTLGAYEPRQLNDVLSTLGVPYGTDLRCRLEVVSGGPVVAFGSLLDGRTNDASTLDMTASGGAGPDGVYVCKQDKTTYDTPVTLTVAGGAIAAVDATVIFTDEDAGDTCGGELLRLAGPLEVPVVPSDVGGFGFSIGGTVDGVDVTLAVSGVLSGGGVTGSVTTTLANAGGCSGTARWPLVGARLP